MADNSDGAAKPRRGPGKPFQPGQSGNPGGKSAEFEAIRIACRDYLANRCLDNLKRIDELAQNAESEKVRFAASVWCAEQVLGKALVSVSGPQGKPIEVDASELRDRLTALLDRAAKSG